MLDEQRVLQTFQDLVAIDNPSGQEQEMAAEVTKRLRALGLKPEQFANGTILARLPGIGEPLLLNAHMDSVAPAVGKRAVIENGIVRSAGDTVLGSDDLVGVTAILEGVKAARSKGNHRAAELVFTVQEEIGLNGARELDYSLLKARSGVALDLNGELGGICVSAPAQEGIRVTITGRAAHAGVAPEDGISAIKVAAEAIAAMPLGRIDEETTANVGVIEGGVATNIVPEQVKLRAEARSRDSAKLDRQVAAMRQALEDAAARHGATIDWQSERAYGPLRIADDAAIVALCQRAAKAAGYEPHLVATGGGSDVNVFNMNGIEAVNLSVGYKDIHSTNEHITVDDIVGAARIVEALLTIEDDAA